MTFGLAVLSLAQIGAVAGPVAAGGGAIVLRRRRRLVMWLLALFAVPYRLAVWAFLIEARMLVVRDVEVAPRSGRARRCGSG